LKSEISERKTAKRREIEIELKAFRKGHRRLKPG
jgi:hypothetical protein